MDTAYLETRIRAITDEDLLGSLRRDLPDLDAVRRGARSGGDRPWRAWREYVMEHRGRRSLPEPAALRGDADSATVISEADLLIRRDVKCWGGVRIKYRGEIDFSRNLSGSANYGFHYFGWIAPLAAAWRATRQQKYARAFVRIFSQWYRQRELVRGDHPRFDVIWYELGTGARMPVFVDLYFATLDAGAARSPAYHRDMLKTALGHGRWLYAHETSYQPGNWQMYGVLGLLVTGLAFPELKESGRWVRRSLRWLGAHAERDVYPDGCHRERAPHYHLGVAGSFLSAFRLLGGAPEIAAQRAKLGATAGRMLRWTASVMTPSGHSPVVGDSEYDVPRPLLLRAGVELRDRELVGSSAAGPREIARASHAAGVRGPISPRRPPRGPVGSLGSGFVVIRSGPERDALWVLANHGPWGGGHSHEEALAIQYWDWGKPLLVDCGRGISYDDPLHRSWYVTPYAHTMLVVDGERPAVDGRRGRLLFTARAAGVVLVGLEHRGYEARGVLHRRFILASLRHHYLVLIDVLRASSGGHRYEWVANTPVRGLRRIGGAVRAEELTIACASPEGIEAVKLSSAPMCLPLEGRSTWGAERGSGTNLRFAFSGGNAQVAMLIAPFGGEGIGISATRTAARSRSRLLLRVATRDFEDAFVVDCAAGSIGAARALS